MTRWAMPRKRRKLETSSKLPTSGVIPNCRSAAARSGDEVNASSRGPRLPAAPVAACNALAARCPTSPQPMMSTRVRRKRAGNARRGVGFEGKIAYSPLRMVVQHGALSAPLHSLRLPLGGLCAKRYCQG